MAVTSIMTTDAEIKAKVGAGVSVDVTETMYNSWVLQAESLINILIRINFSDAITAGLNADVKSIFSDFVSSKVAAQAIAYDMSGYTNIDEAQSMINLLMHGYQMVMSILRDKKFTTFINKA